MTLHWWMHWFWVTAQIVVSLTSPTSERPMKSTIIPETTTTMPVVTSISSESYAGQQQQRYSTTETLAKLQQSYRIAKAIGLQPTETAAADAASIESLKQTYTTDSPKNNLHVITTPIPVVTSNVDKLRSTPTPNNGTILEMYENKTGRIPGKKDTKITWIHGFSKPPKLKYEEKTSTLPSDIDMPDELLTVMPLQDNFSKSHDPNAIHREQQHTNNRSIEEQLLGEETVEPHVIATAASILDANVADSTRLGRARGAFNSEFKVDQLSRENQRNNENNDNESETVKGNTVENGSANVTEIATITGSCLAIIILLSTVGSLGFIMYRRRYLNPPQTLNSDKCSNPDSSGYIDDSTIRDNSEEMYSLDNDSFLNSLEAMTIQNYWTDSVKHTKL